MLTENDYIELINSKYNLRQDAINYLTSCLILGPSRRVGSHTTTNIVSWAMSNKTNQTVSTESHTAESAFRILSEYDQRIKGILEQGQPINIKRTNKFDNIGGGYPTV